VPLNRTRPPLAHRATRTTSGKEPSAASHAEEIRRSPPASRSTWCKVASPRSTRYGPSRRTRLDPRGDRSLIDASAPMSQGRPRSACIEKFPPGNRRKNALPRLPRGPKGAASTSGFDGRSVSTPLEESAHALITRRACASSATARSLGSANARSAGSSELRGVFLAFLLCRPSFLPCRRAGTVSFSSRMLDAAASKPPAHSRFRLSPLLVGQIAGSAWTPCRFRVSSPSSRASSSSPLPPRLHRRGPAVLGCALSANCHDGLGPVLTGMALAAAWGPASPPISAR